MANPKYRGTSTVTAANGVVEVIIRFDSGSPTRDLPIPFSIPAIIAALKVADPSRTYGMTTSPKHFVVGGGAGYRFRLDGWVSTDPFAFADLDVVVADIEAQLSGLGLGYTQI